MAGGPFVGRGDELAALVTAAASARLVTLCGPPGVGKSRVAREWARTNQVLVVELVDAADGAAMCARVADALGVPGADAARIAAVLAAKREWSLLLDDVEQTAGARKLISGWLAATERGHIVVTSRVMLGVAGEQVLDLLPLPLADAIALFLTRARAVRASFSPGQEDHALIEAIAKRVDCLPLAIELAATRIRVLSPAQLWQQLDRSFDVLSSGELTMRAAIEGSWQGLAPRLRDALASASVFCAGFSLPAAEAVFPGGRSALDAIQELGEHSLLQTYQPPGAAGHLRYRLLESIRDFAASKLAQPDEARRRHLAFYRALALGGSPLGAPLDLSLDTDNLVAALRHALSVAPTDALTLACALDPVLKRQGRLELRAALLDDALTAAQAAGAPAGAIIDAILIAAEAKGELGREAECRADRERAHALARELADPRREGRALAALGRQAWHAGAVDDAVTRYRAALALHEASDDQVETALTLGNLANAHTVRGEMEEARAGYERALEILRVADSRPEARGLLLGNLANVEQNLDELELADRHLDQAVSLLTAAGERYYAGPFMLSRGEVLLARGRLREAEAVAIESLTLLRELGNRRWEGVAHLLLAEIAVAGDDRARARNCFETAAAQLVDHGHPILAGVALAKLARFEAGQGHIAVASVRLAAARERLVDQGPIGLLAEVCEAHLHLARGDDAKARAVLDDPAVLRAAERSCEVRWALAGLRADLSPRVGRTLVVGGAARSFQLPDAEPVDLSRRRALRLIVEALVLRHEQKDHSGLHLDELLALGWPGESVLPEAGQTRVYTAISTLRRMGLRDLLLRRDDGYLLDPSLTISRA